MRFSGADLHKKSITFCVVGKSSRGLRVVARKRIARREVDRIRRFLQSHAPCQVTVEATIGYEWSAGVAERIAERVVIAHAGKLRVIAESTRKTDKIDACVLAGTSEALFRRVRRPRSQLGFGTGPLQDLDDDASDVILLLLLAGEVASRLVELVDERPR